MLRQCTGYPQKDSYYHQNPTLKINIYLFFSPDSYKIIWAYSSSWDSIFQFLFVPAHELASDRTYASDSSMSYEVHSEETGQLSRTENISMVDAGFLPKPLSARMEVAVLVACLHKQSEL